MSEAQEQVALFQWAQYALTPEQYLMMFAIPNGGSRNIAEACNLKRQGVKRGVPDIMLAVPISQYHGLFIEMKFGKNKASNEQVKFIEQLNKNGYIAVCVTGWDKARECIIDYLKEG